METIQRTWPAVRIARTQRAFDIEPWNIAGLL